MCGDDGWPSGACSGHGSLSVVHRKCEKSKISVVTVEKKVNFIIDLNFSFLFCKSALETSHISKGIYALNLCTESMH